MSLINQMLKDLDARSSEVTGMNDAYRGQIRAVAGRRRIHPAWWLALMLSVVLAAVLSWMLLKPSVSPQQGGAAQLPLKADFKLDTQQQPLKRPGGAENSLLPSPSPAITAEAAKTMSTQPDGSAVQAAVAQPASSALPAKAMVGVVQNIPPKPTVADRQVKEKSSARGPENFKAAPTAKSVVTTEGVTLPESAAPIAISKQVIELTPQQHAENEYRKAIQLIQQGKATDAVNGLEQALQLDAHHIAARQALIGLLLDGKRQDEAIQKAREGLALDPAQVGLAMILARLEVEKGDLSSAIGALDRSLPYGAGRADYEAFLAALLQRDGKHKQASERFLSALQKAPQNGVWWMGLGISYQAEGRVAEAQEAFKRAKATNTLSPELLAFVESRLAQIQH